MSEATQESDPLSLAARLSDRKLPPVDTWDPDFCGDIDMRIARDGVWYYNGSPIGRKRLVKLFASVLRRDPDNQHYLVTPVEKLRIKVDDAPFLAVEIEVQGSGTDQVLLFRTNVDDVVHADETHPIRVDIDPHDQQPSPYVLVRKGLEALIARSVFYELVALGVERDGANGTELGVWSTGQFFSLGRLNESDC